MSNLAAVVSELTTTIPVIVVLSVVVACLLVFLSDRVATFLAMWRVVYDAMRNDETLRALHAWWADMILIGFLVTALAIGIGVLLFQPTGTSPDPLL